MNSESSPTPDASPSIANTTTPARPRRPWWYWLLLFLPATIAVVPTAVDWMVYSKGGGGDGLRWLSSGLTFSLAGMAAGLITSVFLAGWEVRHRSPKASAALTAVTAFLSLQFLNLGLTFIGCVVASWLVQ